MAENLGKIVIVEDNKMNLDIFSEILKEKGYDIAATQDANEAIDLIRKFIPNLIIMDIRLNNGICGLQLIREIKDDKYIGGIPLVAVTAFAMKDDREKIMASGCNYYLTKPIQLEAFIDAVEKFINT